MIIIEITFFTLLSLILIFSLFGLGKLLVKKKNENFFESVFFGFIVISFLITFIHFFIEINFYVSLAIIIFGFLYGLKNFSFSKKIIKKNYIIYFLIFLILIPIYISQKYHEDFGYYHLPYIINIIN